MNKTTMRRLVFVAALALSTWLAPLPASAASAPSLDRNGCRLGDPLANVWGEDRLSLVHPCLTVTGTVAVVTAEDDGDYHVDLQLDPGQEKLLNSQNRAAVSGRLVTEIVPADQAGCAAGMHITVAGSFNAGVCTGANIAIPKIGAHVSEVGPYVLDVNHGWMEIHPVWSVTNLGVDPAVCRYVLGFATLYDLIPDTIGTCVAGEQYNRANGNGQQQTTKGLLVWRKNDNVAGFTDGYRTWLNGPHGLQERLNTQRFPWEKRK